MNILDMHATLAPRGAELIAAVKESRMSTTELAHHLDIPLSRASLLQAIAEALNKHDLSLAAEHHYSVDRLHEISSIEKRLKNPDVNVPQLRQEIITTCANLSHRELQLHIRKLIAELNDGYQPVRAWYLRYAAKADSEGMKYMIAKMPAEHIDRLRATLTPQARALAAQGQAVSEAEGHAMALVNRCLPIKENVLNRYEHHEAEENRDNPLDLRHRPCFLIPVDDPELLRTGKVVNTDGAVMDLRDLIDARVQEFGFAVACGPDADGVARPQKIFEIKRLADASDRFLTIISHLVCQHADCDTPAVRCEIHHIQAFTRGGMTVLENLCPLCRKHNLENDDDPAIKRHGRILKDPKTSLVWYEDYRGRIRQNMHPAQHFNGIAAAQRMHARQ